MDYATQTRLREYAADYCRRHFPAREGALNPDQLNRNLNYMLTVAFDRLHAEFGEVTRKDVILLVESWIMAQGTGPDRTRPMED